jgi:hypothetical protein
MAGPEQAYMRAATGSSSQGETRRRLDAMAGSCAQSLSISSTVHKWFGGETQRRCGLLCVLSIFSSVLMLTPCQT